jgi:hypothetical protein
MRAGSRSIASSCALTSSRLSVLVYAVNLVLERPTRKRFKSVWCVSGALDQPIPAETGRRFG